MSYKNLTKGEKKTSGFTIIEVLIVLAIAGLILLIVFLAVPALRRSGRNTAMKNDVQNVLGGISEFAGANNGALPTSVVGTGDGKVNFTSTVTGSNATDISIQGGTTVSTSATVAAPTAAPALSTIVIVLKAKCNGNTGVTANGRAAAAFYSVELSGGGTAQQCVES